MRLLFSALPLRGHVHPMVPLALACRDAGHAVTFAVDASYGGALPLPRWNGDGAAGEVDDIRRHPDADLMLLARAVLGGEGAERSAAELATALTEDPADLVVHDATDVGAAVAAELAGVASVAFDVGHWRPLATDRALLQPVPPSLRALGPPGVPVLDVRSVAWGDGGDAPPRRSRPRVYVTFGTVAVGVDDVIARVRRALRGLGVDVVEAVGRHLDQAAVLATSDVVVHHGGTGTMLGALQHGLPQVVLPQGADQHANARRLAELGAAAVDPASVREAVAALLDPHAPQRRAAAALREEMFAMPAPADVVPELERFARNQGGGAEQPPGRRGV